MSQSESFHRERQPHRPQEPTDLPQRFEKFVKGVDMGKPVASNYDERPGDSGSFSSPDGYHQSPTPANAMIKHGIPMNIGDEPAVVTSISHHDVSFPQGHPKGPGDGNVSSEHRSDPNLGYNGAQHASGAWRGDS